MTSSNVATISLWPWVLVAKPLLESIWLTRLKEYEHLVIGFSGGLDSTVLLHELASYPELHSKMQAIHINHGISPNAAEWQNHCEQFAKQLGIKIQSYSVDFDRQANIEEGARTARYAALTKQLTNNDCLIVGHHRDDQAETLLLQLFRGAGIDGLAAMPEMLSIGLGTLLRPFLSISKEELYAYVKVHNLSWIDDESNEDTNYSRNFLRNNILPMLAEKWPNVLQKLARTATHCQEAQANLTHLAHIDSEDLAIDKDFLSIQHLKTLSYERIVNVLRTWLKCNQIKIPSSTLISRIVNELILTGDDTNPQVGWSQIIVRRFRQTLYLDKKKPVSKPQAQEWNNFPAPLIFDELASQLTVERVSQGLVIQNQVKLSVKFRQGGEQFFWHGQHKCLKKLLQQWGVPPWLRDSIPLIYCDDKIAVIVGHAISDLFYSSDTDENEKFSIRMQPINIQVN